LMKLMLGLLRGTGGCVVNGYVPWRRDPAFLESVFFVPDSYSGDSRSVLEMADGTGMFYREYSRESFLRYTDELDVSPGQRLSEMSFGQRKKGLIALALAMNVKFLMMDEPTNGLDIPSKVRLSRLLHRWPESHNKCTMLISTHQVRDLEDVIESVVILGNGQILLNESQEGRRHRSGAELEKLFNDIITSKL